MNNYTTKMIPLTNLSVNIENPRFEMAGNQREAIYVMIDEQGEKLVTLAKDIVEIGLINPSELTIVTPHEKEEGNYNVLEGNRRVIALKVLSNPDVIDTNQKWFSKKIRKLSEEFQKRPITEIQCVVFSKQEDAYRWIKLKHTGENEGVGTVRWDAQQTARFNERVEGVSKIALQALDFLRNDDSTEEELKKKLKYVPSTSLERLLQDTAVQNALGISISNGRLQTNLEESEVAKGLRKIVKDLVGGTIKVKDIYTKEDRKEYIQTFHSSELPDKKNKLKISWDLASPQQRHKTPSKKPSPLSTERHPIIPKDCVLKIKDNRINKIYSELKSLNSDHYVNAAAVLIRVFIELSVDAFIDKHKLPKVNENSELRQKVEAVANYFESQKNIMDKHQLKPIRVAVGNVNSILSIHTFNAYIHNRYFSPIANDLKTTWDNIQLFVVKIWENIR